MRSCLNFAYRALGLLILWVCTSQAIAQSNPAFWLVSSKTAKVYLLGSMHFGRSDFYPLPSVIEEAFDKADVLAVEINIADLDPTTAMASLYKHGRIAEGGTLQSVVSTQTYALLKELCQQYSVPISAFEQFQPWFAAMQLVEVALRNGGLQQHLGIELHFLKRATGKRIDELETLESQLKIFSELTKAEQESFLKQSLADLHNSEQYISSMSNAWKTGDLEALNEELIEPFRRDAQSARLFEKLFVKRNLDMVRQTETYLKSNQTVFLVVGAGHLAGNDGIVAELRKREYPLKQLAGKAATQIIKEVVPAR